MATVIATTDVWCEPNPNSKTKGGYNPKSGHHPLSLEPDCCPCDGCPKYQQCKDEALACQVFDDWVHPWRAKGRAMQIVAKRIPGKAFLKDR